MLSRKHGIVALDVSGCLTNDLDIVDNGILHQFVFQESYFRHIFSVSMDAVDRLGNLFQIIPHANWVLSHTGSASAST